MNWTHLVGELIGEDENVRSAAHLADRHASLQYFTSLQTFAQRRRHEKGRPHDAQIFSARRLGGTCRDASCVSRVLLLFATGLIRHEVLGVP